VLVVDASCLIQQIPQVAESAETAEFENREGRMRKLRKLRILRILRILRHARWLEGAKWRSGEGGARWLEGERERIKLFIILRNLPISEKICTFAAEMVNQIFR